ncbi:Tol-Pal system protein TolB [Nitratifractor sp.]|uniref:Tol-Pal system protein TolB n=1 Tax=Nitratifractor sp. TaxID=2268144 RepID=UPI0025E804D8|nr:Tol-Pal system protein TolB [Nitratifractor sp.]
MRALFLIFTLFSFLLADVDATMKIEKDVDQRARVAIVDGSAPDSKLGNESFSIFRDDLKITGHFLPDGGYRQGGFGTGAFDPSLRAMEYVLKYRIAQENGAVVLRVKLLKGGDSTLVMERSYRIASEARYPFLIHKAVSEINTRLGFPSVDWINRYVLFARYTGRKESEIGVADYTFHYVKTIVRGGLNLFPVWGDRDQKSIYYTGYSGKLPTLYRLDLRTGKLKRIMNSQGMLVCSDVSRDGQKLLLTMAPQGQPDIYEYSVASGTLRRLTQFSGIDVGGKYADDERTLVFISNRLGYPNVFKKPIQGGPISQLVYHGRNNDSCDAFGSKVVYSSREDDNSFGGKAFNLYLTTTAGDYVRPLTSGGINQFPRFSPDGNTVLYIKRGERGNSIGYIGLTTNLTMLFPLGIQRLQSIDW